MLISGILTAEQYTLKTDIVQDILYTIGARTGDNASVFSGMPGSSQWPVCG